MAYDAITIDTNIFTRNSYRLEDGRLGLLRQFSDGPVEFVLSEIIRREVEKHLIVKARQAAGGLEKSIKSIEQAQLLADPEMQNIKQIHEATLRYEDKVRTRIETFISATGAKIVEADQADMAALTARYFNAAAPFEDVGKKKNEFPDAIALLSLDRWATGNGKKILAVSDDTGWRAYADGSERIDVETDFDKALETVQEHVGRAKALVSTLLSDLVAGKVPKLKDEIFEKIGRAVSMLMVEEKYSSIMQAELTFANVEFKSADFVEEDGVCAFDIVGIGDGLIVASVDLNILATVSGEFELSLWDSVDKEDVPMGSVANLTDVEFECRALMTFEGTFNPKHLEVMLAGLELIEQSVDVDFGEVGPDDDFYE